MTRQLPIVLGLVIAVAGCAEPLTAREEGALIGAGVGAVGGAIIGDQIEGARERRYEPYDDGRWQREDAQQRGHKHEHEHDD